MSLTPRINSIEGILGPNLFINSAFNFWQRGTSVTKNIAFLDDAKVFYLADRMYCEARGTGFILDFDRESADLPSNQFKYGLKITGAQADDICYVGQRIESDDIRPYIGKTLTFSVWVKGTLTGVSDQLVLDVSSTNLGENLWNQDSSYDLTDHTVEHTDSSFNADGTWQRISTSFVVPASAANGLQFNLRTSLSGAINNGDTLITTGWMLNEGPSPGDFRTAGINQAKEFEMCRRYFRAFGGFSSGYPIGEAGTGFGTTSIRFTVNQARGMRGDVVGGVVRFTTAGTFGILCNDGVNHPGSVVSIDANLSSYCRLNVTGLSGCATNRTYMMHGGGAVYLDAEL